MFLLLLSLFMLKITAVKQSLPLSVKLLDTNQIKLLTVIILQPRLKSDWEVKV